MMATTRRFHTQGQDPLTRGHMAHYWRTRIETLLNRLEIEARRMLQLEADLAAFATEYYQTVGAATERLAALEQRMERNIAFPHTITETLPEARLTREAAEARKRELKTRYRQLAMEIHPDRASLTTGSGTSADQMQTLNAAYRQGDLATLLKLEAEMLLAQVVHDDLDNVVELERALRELNRAADTYAQAYRDMLHSPLNELMLRAMSARLAGWDWMQTVVKKVERTIEEKERALAQASIAQISQWRVETQQQAASA